ncbi:MAG: ABC transporter ATP-binding protein, partial [Myxococcota bacterium]|nr:ABC transporter ATP-binding protein [Myxococcota bacterium]
DRYFLDRTVDHLLVFQEDNSVVEFPGGYSDWLERKREDAAAAAAERKLEEEQQRSTTSARPNESKRLSYMEQRELDALGPKMAELEEALEAIDQEMAERHDDYTLLQELTERKQAVSAELDEALERWMELEEKQGNA